MRAKRIRAKLAAILGLVLLATAALAITVTYNVPWYSVDGGGGTSLGGAYSLTGTIGQCDAGTMNGGVYALYGGFVQPDSAWPTNAVQGQWWLY